MAINRDPHEHIHRVLDRHQARLQAIPGEPGTAVGEKLRGGQPTGELAIVVFVGQKKAPGELPAAELIPERLDDVPTDVVERDFRLVEQPGFVDG